MFVQRNFWYIYIVQMNSFSWYIEIHCIESNFCVICVEVFEEIREALEEPEKREEKFIDFCHQKRKKNVRERGGKHSEHSHDFLCGCLMVIVSTLRSFACENSLEVNLQINYTS